MLLEQSPIKDLPAWYSLDTTENRFLLSVHKQGIIGSAEYYQLLINFLYSHINTQCPFIPPSADHEWGFGPIISEYQHPSLSDWLIYECSLPTPQGGEEYRVASTLSMIFRQLSEIKHPTNSNFPQMLEVHIDVDSSGRQHSIFVKIRPALSRWLDFNAGKGRELDIIKVMREVYILMRGSVEYIRKSNLNATIRSCEIKLVCPGNGCWLAPAATPYGQRVGEAYEMTPHNIDDIVQLLTLTVGVAKVDKLALEDYLNSHL
ncbi:hypothetical protein GYA49_06470 [Candidatus Beckwithbacteria bacterium]|nr:hypothetical protein [Candidatus Beckwithbacteria bacterium]